MKKMMIFTLFLTLALPAYADILIGKVDIQKVLITVKEGVTVKNKLKKEFDTRQQILTKEEEKIRKQQELFKKQSLVLNDKKKVAKENEIKQQIAALQQKSIKFQKEIQEMEQKLKTPILKRVKEIVEEVSKNEKVDMTFEVSMAPIIYAKKQKDITDNVIKLYNKKFPSKK